MVQKTIIPVPTLGGVPTEGELRKVGQQGILTVHGPEGEKNQVQLFDGARMFFHTGTAALLDTFSTNVHGVLIVGTTGEGPVYGLEQFKTIVNSHLRQGRDHLTPYIGILGSDDMVAKQIQEAQSLGAKNFVLGLNHTGDNKKRFAEAMAALDSGSSIWLYNMPTFTPADLDFVRECMKDPRVKGIKDSSGKLVDFRALLGLKKERPDFEIYIGSESIAAELTEDELAITEGIIAGNGNIDPELLAKYTQDPKKYAAARQQLHNDIHILGRVDDDDVPQGKIRNHLHAIKLRASQIIPGIYPSQHVVMYSQKGKLFTPYAE